jgi:hypothetical protein
MAIHTALYAKGKVHFQTAVVNRPRSVRIGRPGQERNGDVLTVRASAPEKWGLTGHPSNRLALAV